MAKGGKAAPSDPILFEDLDGQGDDLDVDFEPIGRKPASKNENDDHLVANDEHDEIEIITDELKGREEEKPAEQPDLESDPELLGLDSDLLKVAGADRDLAFQLQEERNERLRMLAERDEQQRAQHQQQIAALDERLAALPKELDEVKKLLVKAKEEGNTEQELSLLDKFSDLKGELQLATMARRNLGEAPRQSQAPQRQAPQTSPVQPQNTLAQEFQRRNPWINKPQYSAQTTALQQIDQNLFSEGWDPSTPDYFRELDRRLRTRFPDLPRTGAQARPTPGRPPVAPPSRGVVQQNNTSKRVTLTGEDFENMKRFGLDPRDDKARKMYAREKVAIERAERAKAGR